MRSSESPYRAAVSMWFTPKRSSTSSARSASAWLARASAAAPNRVTVLSWPVRPNGRRAIIGTPAGGEYTRRYERRCRRWRRLLPRVSEVAGPSARQPEARKRHPLLEEQPAHDVRGPGEGLRGHAFELVATALNDHRADDAEDGQGEQPERDLPHRDDQQHVRHDEQRDGDDVQQQIRRVLVIPRISLPLPREELADGHRGPRPLHRDALPRLGEMRHDVGRESFHRAERVAMVQVAEVEVEDDLRHAAGLALLQQLDAVLGVAGDDAAVAELARLHRSEPLDDVHEVGDVRRGRLLVTRQHGDHVVQVVEQALPGALRLVVGMGHRAEVAAHYLL